MNDELIRLNVFKGLKYYTINYNSKNFLDNLQTAC
jgi:hypothetical protein